MTHDLERTSASLEQLSRELFDKKNNTAGRRDLNETYAEAVKALAQFSERYAAISPSPLEQLTTLKELFTEGNLRESITIAGVIHKEILANPDDSAQYQLLKYASGSMFGTLRQLSYQVKHPDKKFQCR